MYECCHWMSVYHILYTCILATIMPPPPPTQSGGGGVNIYTFLCREEISANQRTFEQNYV